MLEAQPLSKLGGKILEDSAMIFYKGDRQILPSHHNMPLYVIDYVRHVELRCTLLDPGS